MPTCPATNTLRFAADTSADEIRCSPRKGQIQSLLTILAAELRLVPDYSSVLPPLSPGHEELLNAVHGRSHLILLNCACGIHMLGTYLGAFAHERTSPNSFWMR